MATGVPAIRARPHWFMNRCGQPCSLKLGKGAAARVQVPSRLRQQRPNVGPRVSAGPCGGLRRAAERAYLRGPHAQVEQAAQDGGPPDHPQVDPRYASCPSTNASALRSIVLTLLLLWCRPGGVGWLCMRVEPDGGAAEGGVQEVQGCALHCSAAATAIATASAREKLTVLCFVAAIARTQARRGRGGAHDAQCAPAPGRAAGAALRHASRQSSPARATTVSSAPARTPVPMPSPDGMSADAGAAVAAPVGGAVPTNPAESVKMESAAPAAPLVAPPVHPAVPTTAPKAEVVPAAPAANVSTAPAMPMMPLMPPVANQMMAEVPSDEQLEMALDDLPMLDADDSFNLDALDPAFLPTPAPSGVPLMDNAHHPSGASSKQQSAENSSASVSEDDGSANSGSSIPSASPQSSPGMMSRSPSP
ncbi:hypothetical protein ON010_g10396 [Phytophthora cinnamomi]|nr:hypothetical protein ON010_g10396 [Phytophthora cinnamomi]